LQGEKVAIRAGARKRPAQGPASISHLSAIQEVNSSIDAGRFKVVAWQQQEPDRVVEGYGLKSLREIRGKKSPGEVR
jgi:hypothetical protein